MDAADPRRLLQDALTAARRADEDPSRRPVLERVAQAALARGEAEVAREVLLELTEPSAQAWLHAELGAAMLSAGDPDGARRHLDSARAGLDRPGRWRPRGPAWMGPEAARARLAALYVRLGDRAAALALAESLPSGRRARAHAWLALVEPAFDAGGALLEDAWRAAREAALAVSDSVDGLACRVALAEVACRCGDAVRAASLAHSDSLGAFSEPLRRGALGLAVGRVLAEAGRGDAAARLWRRALHPLLDRDGLGSREAEQVVQIALLQLEHLGPAEAVETLERAVTRAAAAPLSPSPDLRFAWRRLYTVSLDEPLLAAPLRDWLRVQARVPPGWCYVLGLLERETGHLQRARWAAEALERGQEANPEEVESGLLAALLWLRLGETERGIRAASTVLSAADEAWSRVVPGRDREPAGAPTLLAEALLQAGQRDAGAAVARTVVAAPVRCALLRQAAQDALSEGGAAEARALALEAAQALEMAASEGALDAQEAAGVLGILEETSAWAEAGSTLGVVVDAAAQAPGSLAVTSLCALASALETQGSPGAARPRARLADAVAGTSDPEERAHLLLDWLDLAWPPRRR